MSDGSNSLLIGGVKSLDEYMAYQMSHENDKPFTPADAISVARVGLAIKAADMLIHGEVGVTPVIAAMAISDAADGKVGRLIDKIAPDSGWGTTAHGAPWDTYADSGALVIVGGATLKAPRVTATGKASMVGVLGQELNKIRWAASRNHEYMELVKRHRGASERLLDLGRIDSLPEFPKKLEIPSSRDGKISMGKKLGAAVASVITNDFDSFGIRRTLDVASASLATSGVLQAERARKVDYEPLVQQRIEHQTKLTQAAIDLLAA